MPTRARRACHGVRPGGKPRPSPVCDARSMALDPPTVVARTRQTWDDHIEPALVDYIRVPALSVMFDPEWEAHGHLDAVVESAASWGRERAITGLTIDIVRRPGLTPVLVFEVPA